MQQYTLIFLNKKDTNVIVLSGLINTQIYLQPNDRTKILEQWMD